MIIESNPKMTFQFMASRLNLRAVEDFRGVMFIPDHYQHQPADMDHVGVAYGWHGFIGRVCVINIVVQKPECLTRAVIREAFRYPFNVAKCEAVLALVDSTNQESSQMCQRTGFKLSATIPKGGLEGDLEIWVMERDNCRWIRKEH